MTVVMQPFATLDALPAEAEVLFSATPGLFSSRAWWRTVTGFAMPPDTHPCFLLATTGGRPVALLPLRRDAADDVPSTNLTTPYTCLYEPLLAPGLPPAELVAVFAAFARLCHGQATLRLDAMAEDWPALPALEQGAREAGLRTVRFAHFGNWHETVGGLGWTGYVASRPGALRETIRRRLRRAGQIPDAGFDVITGMSDLEAGIDAFEHVYARSWKLPEPFPLFNAALMRETAAAGLLRLGIWRIAGAPVAAQLWIMEQGTATVLKLAHDEAFQAHSPGTVLTALMLRRFFDEEQFTAIDFGRGDDAYKRGWARERRQRIGLVLVDPRRPAGLGFLARHALGRVRDALRVSATMSLPARAMSGALGSDSPGIAAAPRSLR
ncbi:MAG TPA: GNAT family N-acetyltransferase [Acetobacteraceae bacterium]|nr:GNAT family N-acetyltransferase [Acetobacteraceae bacterium]